MPAVSSPVSISVPADLVDRLAHVVEHTGRSWDESVRMALLDHIEDMEDAIMASQRLEDLNAGRSQTRPLEDVVRELGLEN